MNEEVKTEEAVKGEETGVVEKTTEEPKVEVKTVTLDEAQKMVDKAIAKKLPPKEEMDAFKQWKDSQKTEADKQAERDKELETLRQEKLNTQRENALLKKGINENDIDYVMFKVAKMDGEFEDNLELFLKENPKYLSKEEKSVANTTGVKTSGVDSKDSGVMSILKSKHPQLFD